MTQTQQHTDPSIEDFLTQGGAPTDARHWLEAAYDAPDPMAMVGAALCGLLGTIVETQDGEQREAAVAAGDLVSATAAKEEVAQLRAELEAAQAAVAKEHQVVEGVLEVCGKSRGQWAIKIRELVAAAYQPELPAADPEPVPDADDSGSTGEDA